MKTRKWIVLFMLTLFGFSTTTLTGQQVILPEFGIKGGLNLSDMSIDGDTDMRAGFHAGLFLRLPWTERFAVQPEVLYSTKGTDVTYDAEFLGITLAEGETSYNLHYIDVPVMMVYTLAEGLNFHFGPYVGFLLSADFETQTEILNFIEIETQDDIDTGHFNSIDAGLAAGIGMDIGNLKLGLRYNLGLTQVADDEMALDPLLGDARNRVFQVYVGLRF